jgi:hypothetical protein
LDSVRVPTFVYPSSGGAVRDNNGTVLKEDILRNMRRVGLHDRVPEAERLLPDVVDLDRDRTLLEQLGLSRTGMIDAMGGSP